MNESKKQLIENCISIAKDIETCTDLHAYINEALEIRYIISYNKEYLGAEILVAYGGPTITVNTMRNSVEGTWGLDKFEANYNNEDLDEILLDIFNSI